MKREEVVQVIMDLSDDLNCSFEEAAYEIMDDFYEAVGLRTSRSEKEISHLSKEELIDAIWELYPYDGEEIW